MLNNLTLVKFHISSALLEVFCQILTNTGGVANICKYCQILTITVSCQISHLLCPAVFCPTPPDENWEESLRPPVRSPLEHSSLRRAGRWPPPPGPPTKHFTTPIYGQVTTNPLRLLTPDMMCHISPVPTHSSLRQTGRWPPPKALRGNILLPLFTGM